MSKLEKIDGLPLRYSDGSHVHAVQGTVEHGQILMLWTFCLHDVPTDAAVNEQLALTAWRRSTVPERAKPFHLDTDRTEDAMLCRLGAAFIVQYHSLPKAARDLIEDQAGCIVDNSNMAQPRQEIADLIRRHAPTKPVLRKK